MATARIGLAPWFHNKVIDPLLQILRRGAEPKQLAFSVALGITMGVFPICGVTVFLSGMAIALLGSRCHAPSVMLANFIATPIELSLLVPFVRFGEILSGGPQFPLTADAFKKVLTGQASWEVLVSVAHALLGWLVAAPFILATLYVILVPCFKLLVHKFSPVPSSPKKQPNSPADVKLKCACHREVAFLLFMWVFVIGEEPHAGMRDFIVDFEYFAEGLSWYLLEAFEFVAEELLALCLVIVVLVEEFIGFFFCQILIA